ncbi:MAG: tRNA (guanosine(46)-N7)-methyltransferase TrmB [Verrucomicrobiota bacterium]|nr:tRNA (guanosine(46)-N7)-methyltransferase TrmB [Verrucomicrobiota bacterium]
MPSFVAPFDLELVFDRRAPLEVDLGCGDGAVLVALAQQNPERNFLGVERLFGRARSACRKIGDAGLTNARVVRADILHALQDLLPRGSVDVFYLLFPDPWPKRRHETRRTFNPNFLRTVSDALAPNGMLRVATDDAEYFRAMERIAADVPFMERADDAAELPMSTFEARFRGGGLPIHRLSLRKV